MFKCQCGKNTLIYDYQDKKYKCLECGHIEKPEPIKQYCCYCGKEYMEYNWFDPSACSNCNKSFTD